MLGTKKQHDFSWGQTIIHTFKLVLDKWQDPKVPIIWYIAIWISSEILSVSLYVLQWKVAILLLRHLDLIPRQTSLNKSNFNQKIVDIQCINVEHFRSHFYLHVCSTINLGASEQLGSWWKQELPTSIGTITKWSVPTVGWNQSRMTFDTYQNLSTPSVGMS